uniref:Uncharacterized protein n=1 Tax=Populus alba TaxID=43335 RepID=A0A4U5Q809_POPAL|nr:hypothetical protein D5086_0000128030 [Populus alba]
MECQFLWSSTSDKQKVHKIAWKVVVRRNGLPVFSKRLSIVWSDIYLTIKYDDQASSTLRENCKLQIGEGNDEERRELGNDSVENFEEEAEEIVSVEERRDHEREENATGRSAQSGSHYAHPTAAASPAGRVGENPSHPTVCVLPDSGMDDRGDLTASSGHGGSASGNPTARRHADDSTGDIGAYYNPTARRMDGSADADLIARRHAGDRAVRHAGGCADIDDPTARIRPGVCLERSPNRAAEESPSVGSVGLIDSPHLNKSIEVPGLQEDIHGQALVKDFS